VGRTGENAVSEDNNQPQPSREGSPGNNAGLPPIVSFWFVAWFGIVLSGAIYPALSGPDRLFVFVIGATVIGLCATPILAIIAVATSALESTYLRFIAASLAGAISCAVAAVIVLNACGTGPSDGWKLIVMEAIFGSLGCLLFLFGWWIPFCNR
jgi:hypothetical protein